MKPFYEMLRKTTGFSEYPQLMRFVAPLNDHFGINHFWVYRITDDGNYSYFGTHAAWNEYCFEHSLHQSFSCLRHPSHLTAGINLMKFSPYSDFHNVLQAASNKFKIHFNLNIIEKIPNGVEAFGFATRFDDLHAEERLINELSVLRHFMRVFKERYKKLFFLLHDNPINLPSHFGSKFFELPKKALLPLERGIFLRKIGCDSYFELTPREMDIVPFLAQGYPSSYISMQLKLSVRTVENYISNIKNKLECKNKIELIQKAQELLKLL